MAQDNIEDIFYKTRDEARQENMKVAPCIIEKKYEFGDMECLDNHCKITDTYIGLTKLLKCFTHTNKIQNNKTSKEDIFPEYQLTIETMLSCDSFPVSRYLSRYVIYSKNVRGLEVVTDKFDQNTSITTFTDFYLKITVRLLDETLLRLYDQLNVFFDKEKARFQNGNN